MSKKKIQYVMNIGLSRLEFSSTNKYEVLSRVKGETIVRKKLSVVMVLVIVLILLVGTALAFSLLNAYHEKIVNWEAENGLFQEWDVADKVRLVEEMVDLGIQLDEKKVARLYEEGASDAEKSTLATELVEGYYGSGRGGELTIIDFIAKEKGPYESWSLEDRAWLTQLQQKYGDVENSSLYSVNLVPEEQDASQQEAVQTAYKVLSEQYGLTQTQMDQMTIEVFFRVAPQYDLDENGLYISRVIWQIWLTPSDGIGTYWVELGRDGTYLRSGEPYRGNESSLDTHLRDLMLTDEFWTVASLANFRKQYHTLIAQAVEHGEGIFALFVHLSQIPYALPSTDDIPESDAIRVAEETLLAQGYISPDLLALYHQRTSYRIYDQDHPEWRVAFFARSPEAREKFHKGEMPFGYVVRISSKTGEILSVTETKNEGFNRYGEFPDDRDTYKEPDQPLG